MKTMKTSIAIQAYLEEEEGNLKTALIFTFMVPFKDHMETLYHPLNLLRVHRTK